MNSKSSVTVRVLFFAKARELAGITEANFTLSDNKIFVNELLEQIVSKYNLNILKQNLIIAINEEYCSELGEVVELKEGDEIAIIPPISGG